MSRKTTLADPVPRRWELTCVCGINTLVTENKRVKLVAYRHPWVIVDIEEL